MGVMSLCVSLKPRDFHNIEEKTEERQEQIMSVHEGYCKQLLKIHKLNPSFVFARYLFTNQNGWLLDNKAKWLHFQGLVLRMLCSRMSGLVCKEPYFIQPSLFLVKSYYAHTKHGAPQFIIRYSAIK